MIKWELFFEGTSSTDSLIDFVCGNISINSLVDLVERNTPLRKEARKLQKMCAIGGPDKVAALAVEALKRRGYMFTKRREKGFVSCPYGDS